MSKHFAGWDAAALKKVHVRLSCNTEPIGMPSNDVIIPKQSKYKNKRTVIDGLKPKLTANQLTKAALKYFNAKGYECWRQNNAAVYDAKRNSFRANSVKKGVSDIIGYHRRTGQFLAVEIKIGKDKLSTEQEMFLKSVERSGGLAMVVKNVDDLVNFFK